MAANKIKDKTLSEHKFDFYPYNFMLVQVLAMGLCLSVTHHYCIEKAAQTGFWHTSLLRPILHAF